MVAEPTFVDREVPFERIDLGDGAWVDVARRWIADPAPVYEHLLATVSWKESRLFRYDHLVEENRVGSWWARGKGMPLPHPALAEATRLLQHRYSVTFDGFALLQYRTGADGQAFHRDTDMRYLDDTIIAILSFGAARPWRLRPKTARHTLAEGKGVTHDLEPASGDLLVMGGRAQQDWEHSVPYLGRESTVGPRISIQWRFARPVGRPFQGGSYRQPLRYGRDRGSPSARGS